MGIVEQGPEPSLWPPRSGEYSSGNKTTTQYPPWVPGLEGGRRRGGFWPGPPSSSTQILDSELFELMHQNGDYTHFYFCYRWFLLDFKRGKKCLDSKAEGSPNCTWRPPRGFGKPPQVPPKEPGRES